MVKMIASLQDEVKGKAEVLPNFANGVPMYI